MTLQHGPQPHAPAPHPYCVLMDVNRWDTDEGRAWITVNAIDPLDAMRKVREMYPKAAVLRAEVVNAARSE